MVILFYRQLEWFPASGRFTGEPPPAATGFLLIDALIAHPRWRVHVLTSRGRQILRRNSPARTAAQSAIRAKR